MNILRIVEGAFNVLVGRNRDLKEFRLDNGCKRCGVSHMDGNYTGWCQKQNEGCGCNGQMKASVDREDIECPKGIWKGRTIDQDKLIEANSQYSFTPRNIIQEGVILTLNKDKTVTANKKS